MYFSLRQIMWFAEITRTTTNELPELMTSPGRCSAMVLWFHGASAVVLLWSPALDDTQENAESMVAITGNSNKIDGLRGASVFVDS